MLTSESVSWSPFGPSPGRAGSLSASQTAEDKGLFRLWSPSSTSPTSSHQATQLHSQDSCWPAGGSPESRIDSLSPLLEHQE